MDVQLVLVSGLVAVTIGLWATRKLPEYLTALLFFAFAMTLHVAPASLIFSGFTSPAFWLVISGYVIGIAIRKTGLATRFASVLASYLSRSYLQMVAGVIGLTYALAFVMPSNMGRIALLMPIALALATRVGFEGNRSGRIGLSLAVGFGTFQLSASILPANVPNLVMAGAIDTTYGLQLSYLPYLLLHAPVLGILKGVALCACIVWLFPDKPEKILEAESAGPMSPEEKKLSLLLLVTLALWLTDALHGVSPAWVGLVAACLCLLPRIGFVSGEEFGQEVNHRTALYVAAILGLAALVGQSGLGALIGNEVLALAPLSPDSPIRSYASILGLSTILNFVVTANGVPAIFTPLAQSLADASGFPVLSVLMIQVIGFSTPLLPYQASPIVLAMEMGKIPFAAVLRLSLAIAFITFVVLVPINYEWFVFLGWLP
ncbi:MAG: SLC13 family permease [Pseudomonas sp.]|uniref:SLC13 family permease n=1 Tax=Pseudomonas sp. TaxID=306 RepID=UPI003D6FAC04